LTLTKKSAIIYTDMKTEKQKLIKKADTKWQKFILKACDYKCEKCGGTATAVHHKVSRIHKSTRYLILNGIPVCFPCHIHFFHGKPAEGDQWLRIRFGNEHMDFLLKEAQIVCKRTIEDLEKIIKSFE